MLWAFGYGMLWAVGHFQSFLWAKQFTLVMNCSALMWLFRSQDLSPKLHWWALRLMKYNVTLQWRTGASHHLPGALSRLP